MRKLYFHFIFFILCSTAAYSQNNGSIQGKIIDAKTKEPVPLVTVYLARPDLKETDDHIDENSMKGTVTNFDGFYRIEIKPGTYVLHISAVGYKTFETTVKITEDKIEQKDYTIQESAMELNEFVYSESKNSTKLEESTVSISLIKSSLIQNRNATSGDLAIEQIPGITVVESEPQIRGASGFTAGLGSKVLIMIDDVPMLRGDAGRPEWNFLPLENMDQIEVIKGAGSVLYGSGASNGVINIRTAFPKEKPEFMFTAFTGIYNNPKDAYKTPWKGLNPMKSGANFYHSRIFKVKDKVDIDFVVGGQFLWDDGFRGGEPRYGGGVLGYFDTTRVNRGEYHHCGRINFNTRFRVKKIEGLAFGLNGNFFYTENSQSYFWQDTDSNIYRMAPGTLTNFKNFMYYLDPYMTYYNKKGDRYTLRTRLFQHWSDADVKQDSRSAQFFGEFQYSKNFTSINKLKWLTKDLILTTGIMSTYTYSAGEVFNKAPTPDSTSTSFNFAVYAQLEKKFFSRLTVVLGGRWEYFKINDQVASKPVLRTAINFRITEGTFLRASWGQGFRFPTIAERYINTTSGGYGFYSNANLKPESSWSAEVGVKQLFKFGRNVFGFVDVAGFWQEYKNFCEFAFAQWPGEGIGFKFFNTGDARIRGVDASFFIQAKIKKQLSIDFMAGYTYSLPQTTEPRYNYFEQGNIKLNYSNTSSDTTDYILKYRVQHMVKADLNIEWKGFYIGFTTRYYGPMKNIDNIFGILDNANLGFHGINDFMQRQNNGSIVFDARISYKIQKFKIAFIVDNMLNAEYSIRPLGISPPRVTTLQLTYKI